MEHVLVWMEELIQYVAIKHSCSRERAQFLIAHCIELTAKSMNLSVEDVRQIVHDSQFVELIDPEYRQSFRENLLQDIEYRDSLRADRLKDIFAQKKSIVEDRQASHLQQLHQWSEEKYFNAPSLTRQQMALLRIPKAHRSKQDEIDIKVIENIQKGNSCRSTNGKFIDCDWALLVLEIANSANIGLQKSDFEAIIRNQSFNRILPAVDITLAGSQSWTLPIDLSQQVLDALGTEDVSIENVGRLYPEWTQQWFDYLAT